MARISPKNKIYTKASKPRGAPLIQIGGSLDARTVGALERIAMKATAAGHKEIAVAAVQAIGIGASGNGASLSNMNITG